MSSNDSESKLHTCGEKPNEHCPGCHDEDMEGCCQPDENCTGCHDEDYNGCCQSNESFTGCQNEDLNNVTSESHHHHHQQHHDHCHGDHHDDQEFHWLYEITHKGTMTPEDSCKMYDQHADDYEKLINKHACEHSNFVVNDMMEIVKDRNGRILDVGAGTGANGKLLKQRGYSNIDALDGSKEMLKIAKTKNVYNNLIHLILKDGVRIPNVENDTYSAVVMNGVFCPNHCDSAIFPELIRVVKPGGYICWVMNVGEEIDQEKFDTDVEKLCKEGKWKTHKERVHEGYCGEEKVTIMKKKSGMSSNDSGSKPHTSGKKPNEHRPGCHDEDTNNTTSESHHYHDQHHDHCHGDHHDDQEFHWLYDITQKGTMTPEDSCKMYDQHADDYEKLVNKYDFHHLNFAVNDMMEVVKDKNSRILDIGAGSGANGKLLKQRGYSNIDALDGSKEMLKIARTKNVYDNLIHLILKDGVRIPNVENDTYSAVVMSGVFCPNHCDSAIFPELIRVVKPGGYICWDIIVGQEVDQEKFNADVEKLCKEEKWKILNKKVHEGYCGEEKSTTVVTIMEVL
ncbi:uncharacterized protein LOC143246100 isoform X2 [Tachypleus tridentatus]|uniref:uncharacterized protein LOC143246100 isoform X2 n=1 Tax=Tachypleus tridentatus TaxID=6853 RepID=UPI003FD477D4